MYQLVLYIAITISGYGTHTQEIFPTKFDTLEACEMQLASPSKEMQEFAQEKFIILQNGGYFPQAGATYGQCNEVK